jgi:hypothetical protein
VSDQGFDFGPTPPRREARQFEPPPWERDQFERNKREIAEREAAAQEARAKVVAEEEAALVAQQMADAATAEASAGAGAARTLGEGAAAQPETPAPKAEIDEKQVAMMMLGLRAEEPPALEGAWVVNLVAGGVVALIGFASAIWGVTALARKGLPAAGTLGGVILLGFGLGFLGVGGWLVFKALRQRGVL